MGGFTKFILWVGNAEGYFIRLLHTYFANAPKTTYIMKNANCFLGFGPNRKAARKRKEIIG